MGKARGRRSIGTKITARRTGSLLLAAGLLAISGAIVFALGWQAIGEAIGGAISSTVDAAGGATRFLAIIGVALLASGASVLAFARHA